MKYKGVTYCLTRLGFGLSAAPRIMTKILEFVLSSDEAVRRGTDSYIDDVIVNNDIVQNETVLNVLNKFGLDAKPPEGLSGARVLGLKVQKKNDIFYWKRDNDLERLTEVKTKRELFSFCGKLTGHFPVANWLRPMCSYLKRPSSNGHWDDPLDSSVLLLIDDDVRKRLREHDPVQGVSSVKPGLLGRIWCDGSSLAMGVASEVDNEIIKDGCWLRKPSNVGHINLSELESVIKGLNLAIRWGLKTIDIMTDSYTVNQWVSSVTSGDKKVRTKGLGEALVLRCLSLIKDIIKEYDLKTTIQWVRSTDNKADVLTRVPHK